jgi:hypothetical protein
MAENFIDSIMFIYIYRGGNEGITLMGVKSLGKMERLKK